MGATTERGVIAVRLRTGKGVCLWRLYSVHGFLPSLPRSLLFPCSSCLRSAGGRGISLAASHTSLLFLSSTHLRTMKLGSKICKAAQNITRVEGRSYPPLYRAHKWAKGGWAYLRPSPFGIYVGLLNGDLHRIPKGQTNTKQKRVR